MPEQLESANTLLSESRLQVTVLVCVPLQVFEHVPHAPDFQLKVCFATEPEPHLYRPVEASHKAPLVVHVIPVGLELGQLGMVVLGPHNLFGHAMLHFVQGTVLQV